MTTRRQFLASSLAMTASPVLAGNWSQWRGPQRDGSVDQEFAWPTQLSESSLEKLWEVPLGPSYSGPVVMGDSVFVTETLDRERERVTAYTKDSGKLIWEQGWPGAMKVPFFAAANGSWIRATPAATPDYLLVGGIRDLLACLALDTGKEVWRVDFVEALGSKLPDFGFVSSPLIDGDDVYVQAGGGFAKLSLSTGEVLWRSLTDGGGMYGSAFSSPMLATVAGQRQVLVQTRQKLVGVHPDDGVELWSIDVPSFRGMNILTPTVYQDTIFTSTYRNGSFCYQVTAGDNGFQVSEKWKNNIQGYMSSPVVLDDHVYLHLGNGRLTCMDLASGSQKWSSRPFGKYWSTVRQGNQMLALDERGDLLLVKPNPEKFQLAGKAKVADNSWAHLAIDRDLIFVRDLEKLLVFRWT